MMSRKPTIQEAVLGKILPGLGRRSVPFVLEQIEHDTRSGPRAGGQGSGGGRSGGVGGLQRNVMRVPQSIVKRVGQGGTRNGKELSRQMNYITRDEALQAAWSNQVGFETGFEEDEIGDVVSEWTATWKGQPKHGHTDHIILSFPKGTEADVAQGIAREWGQEVFGSGNYQDRFAYVAALHHNTDQVHAHFIVNKHGMEQGSFLSISRFAEINYQMMRELHVDIAHDHGLALNATSRLSRYEIEHAPRQLEVQMARSEGREPTVEPLSDEERARRMAVVREYAVKYHGLSEIAAMQTDGSGDDYMSRLFDRAKEAAERGSGERVVGMSDFNGAMPAESIDPGDRLPALQASVLEQARSSWAAIREMDPGEERADLERQFNRVSAKTVPLHEGEPFYDLHGRSLPARLDPYHDALASRLAQRAYNDGDVHHAEADRSVQAFRDALRDRLSPYEAEFEMTGTNAEEMAARLSMPSHSSGQIEAWREAVPEAMRSRYAELEGIGRAEAASVARTLSVADELLHDLARQEIIEAAPNQRLCDLPVVDRLVDDTYASMTNRELRQMERGRGDVLDSRIVDPGLRAAVTKEIEAIEALPDGAQISDRESQIVAQYQPDRSVAERLHEIETSRSVADDTGWSI